MMFRIFQFINHCGSVIFDRDMAVPYDVYNHIIFSQPITPCTYSRTHICCRREEHPVYFFLFLQEVQIKLS